MAEDEGPEVEEAPDLEEPKPEQGRLAQLFGSFNKLFWVVNAFELFERGAYYGTMSVLGVHVVLNILAEDPTARALWGSLYSFLIILLYFLPLFSAALADKFGYKQILVVSFSFMLLGYTALTMVQPGQFGFLVGAFFLVGIGAGMFKPIISASIAHVTPEEKRNLAYSIYYWMINLGAMVFPFAIGLYFTDTAMYYYVFLVSTGLVAVNMVILFTMFRNPVQPMPELKVTQALQRIVPALRDRKFVVLLVIYAGFWFMFAYNHTFLPLMMVEFGRMPEWFSVPFLATINPGTIVVLGPFLGKAVEKYKSLNVMMAGMVIFCIGFAMNGMSNNQFLFVTGIIVFSIGEFIVHPGFISYVSKIAPKDKVAIYLACIFISTGLGQLVGGFTQGLSYNYFAYNLQRPQVYIATVIAVGLVTLVAFMIYNRQQMAEALRRDPTYEPDRGIWTKPVTGVVVLLFIPITFWGAYAAGPMDLVLKPDGPDGGTDWTEWDIVTGSQSFSEYTAEQSASDTSFDIVEPNVIDVTLTLSWQDEADWSPRHTNEPDEFSLEVFAPDGREATADFRFNPQGGTGQVSVSFDFEPDEDPYMNGTGEWVVTVIAGECGDHVLWRPSIGIFDQPDNGNAWDLDVSYRYYEKPEQPA
jgi:MFS family permease